MNKTCYLIAALSLSLPAAAQYLDPTAVPPAAGAEAATVAPLSLADAIHQAITANPQARAALEGIDAANAREHLARASLLPNLGATVSEQRRTVNLAAQGLSFPGIATFIGPYNVFDARAHISQTAFDWSKILRRRNARLAVEISRAQEALAREQLASRLSVAFIQVLQQEQALTSANADLSLARDLFKLSDDQHRAGLATGVDVARAQTQVAQDEFAVSRAQTGLAQSRLSLQRLLNIEQGAPLNLAGSIDFVPQNLPTVEEALKNAQAQRAELSIAQQQLAQAEMALKAARAQRLPTLNLSADYGQSSNTPVQGREDTYDYGAQIDIPIFSGGAIDANIEAAKSDVNQARLTLEDVGQQVEEDVRMALTTLDQSAEQVRAAASSRDLATRELELTRDRFAQGLANNIEVTQAQTELSNARFNYVSALATYSIARANLAAALGRAEQFNL